MFGIWLAGCMHKDPHRQAVLVPNSTAPADSLAAKSNNSTPGIIKHYKDFKEILLCPVIKDTADFIVQLRAVSNSGLLYVKLKKYYKAKFYGSKKNYVIVETDCDFNNVKHQVYIFTESGKFLKMLESYRYEFIKIFPQQNPVLMNLEVTSQGNGGHEFFRMENDTLKSMNEKLSGDDYMLSTFDRHEDYSIYEPAELKLAVKDDNHDGYNDIIFKGTIVLIEGRLPDGEWYEGTADIDGKQFGPYSIEHPFKKARIKFVYLFNPKTLCFEHKEDYPKKYKEYF
jgi:hypothetical protein